MDTYKLFAFTFVMITLTLISSTMSDPDKGLSNYFDSTQDQATNDYTRTTAGNLADPDYAYTPQNEANQNEGTGGVSVEKTVQGSYGIMGRIMNFFTERQDQARAGMERGDSFGVMAWIAIGLFWSLLSAFIILKIVNFIKNKDST